MNRFILVGTGKDYVKRVWESLITRDDVQWFDQPLVTDNRVSDILSHIHSSFLLNRYFDLPFKSIWKEKYAINKAEYNPEDTFYLVLFDNTLSRYTPRCIREFKKEHPNTVIILFMDNAMHKKERLIQEHLENVDLVYTNNKYDADKYGFKYVFNIIPFVSDDEKRKCDIDVFFVGNAYDRIEKIHTVYDRLEKLGLRVKMYVSGVNAKDKSKRKNIVYNQSLPYHDVIDYYNRSVCLLEVVGEKPTMLTMRMMEALARNKKLITNHPIIKEQEFYDPRFILYFDDPEGITLDFFQNNTEVKYNFENKYTPELFLQRIVDDYNEKEKI